MKSWWAWLASAFGMIVEIVYQSLQKKLEPKLEPVPEGHQGELKRSIEERRRAKFGR